MKSGALSGVERLGGTFICKGDGTSVPPDNWGRKSVPGTPSTGQFVALHSL